ncbi:hypothetical protein CEXT_645131 [Caerostris extrusa]|uniref:Uncharacterized protein n=1 Tax=Caerostris extrusa TaxID=172846 RepID=A0AAV4RT14_CAEEX|nr:hypothetical protein CEXT_645131 [Caerostris extrusa]
MLSNDFNERSRTSIQTPAIVCRTPPPLPSNEKFHLQKRCMAAGLNRVINRAGGNVLDAASIRSEDFALFSQKVLNKILKITVECRRINDLLDEGSGKSVCTQRRIVWRNLN